MPKLKTRKTVEKRFKITNPRGGKKVKVLYNKSKTGHLRTKKSSRTINRELPSLKLSGVDRRKILKMIRT